MSSFPQQHSGVNGTGTEILDVMPTLADLARHLARMGFHPGAPANVTKASREADAACARAMKCGACKQRLAYHPFHKGRTYAAVAACPACNSAEPM